MIERSLNYGREHIQQFVLSCPDPKLIVDAGAGTGADLLNTREIWPHATCHAIEMQPANAAILDDLGFVVHRARLERERLPFDDESVDVVIANQILEHLKDVFWFLHEVARVLAVGGSLIIGVPNLAALHNRLLLLVGRQPTQIRNASAHVRGFTYPDLVELLDVGHPEGWTRAGRRGANFYPLPPWLAVRAARVAPTLAWGISARFVKSHPYSDGYLAYLRRAQLETDFFMGDGGS